MLNDLTERNMEAWRNMQRGLLDTATQATTPPRGTTTKKPG